MPIGSPKSKAQELREQAARELLDRRRNPQKYQPKKKFRKRMMEFPIEVCTEVDEREEALTGVKARDIPFRVQAEDGITAVRLVLDQLKLQHGELLHVIHIGQPKWLETSPIGREE